MQTAHDVPQAQQPLRQRITNVTKQSVLNLGVRRLHRRLVVEGKVNVTELPKRANGTCGLLAAAFFERLLGGQLELKNCMNSDVSAAQLDIRNLTLEQLLTIHVGALDFTTASDHHHAHMNFIWMVNMHLFEKLARQCVQVQDPAMQGWLAKLPAKLLHSLGMKLVLLLGAGELLAKSEEGANLPCPFACWVLQLEEKEWADYKSLLFKANELQVELLKGERPDLTRFMDCGLICMAWERAAGAARPGMLDLEITTINPTDAALVAWQSPAAPALQHQRQHATDLADAIARRSAVAADEVASEEVKQTEASQNDEVPVEDINHEDACTESELELETIDSENFKPANIQEMPDIEKDMKHAISKTKSDFDSKAPNQLGPKQLALRLQHLGYPNGDDEAWQKGLLPETCLRVTGHKKVDGHRWYTLECQLAPCNGGEPTLEWSVRRRLAQLTELHHIVKQELGDEYKDQFVATPFAKRFRPRGTTERLSSWCLTLAGCMSTGLLRPEAVGQILHRLEAPTVSGQFPQVI
mmetsp:Transcript_114330/g.207935  ORF Transcript_114330/g.207935 Transcript_114330/m.207935 type:complete len:527 (+) Transcript_114330:58-1638(+)